MCERSSLFLIEAKSILYDLLKRTLELFDLCFHFVEHYRIDKYFIEREQKRDYNYFSLSKPCKLNFNIISDIDIYLHRLYTSCRLTRSNLRSLHASRMLSSHDYIVIDDEIYELIKFFQLKVNKQWHQYQSREKEQEKTNKFQQFDHIINRRYHSQRMIHNSQTIESFVFLPETSKHNNNSQQINSSNKLQSTNSQPIDEYHHILIIFRRISYFYQLLIDELYGVHSVQDSDILQLIVVNIIRLLLFIANKLKQYIKINSSSIINNNHFRIKRNEEICRVEKKPMSTTKSKFKLIEIHPTNINTLALSKSLNDGNFNEENNDKNIEYVRNDNHSSNIIQDNQTNSLDFDEDEFYRLANLERDD
ncbi:unnamed protein product [Rotaria sp. Silwood2]|nr:unnamed protein product [Rotaria sp. Silwood2]